MVTASGFEDQALGSQAVFRALLDGMAEPGRLMRPATVLPVIEPPSFRLAFAVALTLVDGDTPVWVDQASARLCEDLRFHCGCPLVDEPAECRFAILTEAHNLARLGEFAIGSPDYPDRSATLIVQIEALGQGEPLTLCGPGIRGTTILKAGKLPDAFEALWRANRRHWPCGVDLVLVSQQEIACLPRTTSVKRA